MTDEHAMKVAKVIAKAMGDNFADAFKNKEQWIAKRGMSGGRFRDVNEPFQHDYLAAAEAAAAIIAADRAELVERVKVLEDDKSALVKHGLETLDQWELYGEACGILLALLRKNTEAFLARATLKDTSHDADA